MKATKKNTYAEWLAFEFIHENTPSKFDRRGHRPPMIGWDKIEPSDVQKIKEHQKDLFKTAVDTLMVEWKNDLLSGYKSLTTSDERKDHITRKKVELEQLMSQYTNPRKSEYVKHYDKVFSLKYFDFVHAPGSPYQYETPPEVHLRALYEFKEWLEKAGYKAKNKPTGPMIAAFCSLVDRAGIVKLGSNKEQHIKTVCKKYGLDQPPARARNDYPSGNPQERRIKEVEKYILPNISEPDRKIIADHIASIRRK